MPQADTLIQLFRFKKWADTETLQAISKVDVLASPKNHHLMLRLMNHIHVVDEIFKANLTGLAHGYTALNTPETPSCQKLMDKMLSCDEWFISYIENLDDFSLSRIIRFTFVDGGQGKMKAIDMLNHVSHHGTYHRGAVGWLLSECKVTPPKDVLTVFLRDHCV
ncbi:DinB family protein [Serratia aquatilis]|uniref:DinB family protein n=2 Tax=Serratia aquatilis TaxID=1737515 RepID=A0ABV6EGB9_9GAMM